MKKTCLHDWRWYDGCLGYESQVCGKCGADIKDAPPVVLVIVEGGLIQEIVSSAPVQPVVADLDVFDAGDLEEAQSFEPSEWETTIPGDFARVVRELWDRIKEEKSRLPKP